MNRQVSNSAGIIFIKWVVSSPNHTSALYIPEPPGTVLQSMASIASSAFFTIFYSRNCNLLTVLFTSLMMVTRQYRHAQIKHVVYISCQFSTVCKFRFSLKLEDEPALHILLIS